jgi:hypothetical protein
MTDNPLEIPQTLRDLAEENMRQAHAAYEKLIEFVTRSLNAWTSQMPSNPLTAGFKDVQNRAMEFATDNAESAFAFAGKINNARTLEEVLTLQTQFAQDRMQAFVTHTRELSTLIAESVQNSRSG